MASKYTLKDLPTSGKYTYKGKDYPKWDVDGLPVSSNDLWVAMGMDDHTFNPATDPEGDAIERNCIVWTDETKPIDAICGIASEQGGSGTTEKIVADLEKLIKLVTKHIELTDWEMDHGDYHVPDNYIPHKYEDESDYYGQHEKIVDKVCKSYERIRKFIAAYEKRTGQEVK